MTKGKIMLRVQDWEKSKVEIDEIVKVSGDLLNSEIVENPGVSGQFPKTKHKNRVIICGGRNITDPNLLMQLWASSKIEIDEVVSGACRTGVDKMGEELAYDFDLPIKRFPANWNIHGKAAGPIRNELMARYATHMLIIWDGKSRGSGDMLRRGKKHGLRIFEMVIVGERSPVCVAPAKSWYDVA